MTNSEKKKQNIFRAAITDIANHKCLYLMALPVILFYAVFCYSGFQQKEQEAGKKLFLVMHRCTERLSLLSVMTC